MGETTKIAWCDSTIEVWGPQAARSETKTWERDLRRWNREALASGKVHRVFAQSLSDTFEEYHGGDGVRLARPVSDPMAPGGGIDALTLDYLRARFLTLAADCSALTFQLLTKRPENVCRMVPPAWLASPAPGSCRHCGERASEQHREGDCRVLCGIRTGSSGRATVPCTRNRAGWPGNVWVGTSVGTQASAEERIPHLLRVPARVRFLSVEPQLEEVDLSEWIAPASCCSQCGESYPGIVRDEDAPCGHDLITTWGAAQRERYFSGERYANGGPQARDEGPQIAWVIQGGESGPRARPFDLAWARSLRDQCKAAHVAYFLKQLGARPEADWKGWETGQTYERGVVRLRDSHGGGDESEWPADLRGCRAFPEVHP